MCVCSVEREREKERGSNVTYDRKVLHLYLYYDHIDLCAYMPVQQSSQNRLSQHMLESFSMIIRYLFDLSHQFLVEESRTNPSIQMLFSTCPSKRFVRLLELVECLPFQVFGVYLKNVVCLCVCVCVCLFVCLLKKCGLCELKK
jgi:hypothetical protein